MDTYRVTNKETGATYTAEGESAKDVAAKTNWPAKICKTKKVETAISEPDEDEGGS
ncbi:hypothetical protein ES703_125498 [subsurface metagenome]